MRQWVHVRASEYGGFSRWCRTFATCRWTLYPGVDSSSSWGQSMDIHVRNVDYFCPCHKGKSGRTLYTGTGSEGDGPRIRCRQASWQDFTPMPLMSRQIHNHHNHNNHNHKHNNHHNPPQPPQPPQPPPQPPQDRFLRSTFRVNGAVLQSAAGSAVSISGIATSG